MNNLEKLTAFRKEMSKEKLDAYIITLTDPHINEYLPDHYKSIAWLCGFTGSAGTLIITADFAGLWTDSRYFVQAEEQLQGTGCQLVKLQNQGVAEYVDWLATKLLSGQRIGFDGRTISVAIGKMLDSTLGPKGISLQSNMDLIERVWPDRPPLPSDKAYLLSESISGRSTAEKLQQLKTALKNQAVDVQLISSLDDIAWLFNMRGSDVKCNPVVLSFVIISQETTKLFIDPTKLSTPYQTSLTASGISLHPYTDIEKEIEAISGEATVFVDPKRTCFTLYQHIPISCKKIEGTNPSTFFKAVKNETELTHIRKTMIKDGVALTRFFYWLDSTIGKHPISELSIAEKLREFRKEQDDFIGESFDTIAGYKAHGALPHYKATAESDAELENDGLLLIDSGGQYTSGTTDITRVVSLGNISKSQQQDYTLVLKGMIEGSSAYFPEGTKGYQIDAITRKPLWDHHRNYGHGTGHGVGFFLNVHEGPQVFNTAAINIPIQAHMVTSIEPGIYREGQYGIRIENLVVSYLDQSADFGQFMAFETLTLCYIDTALIDKSFLYDDHITWLNNYNKEVYTKLSPYLLEEEKKWLQVKTTAI